MNSISNVVLVNWRKKGFDAPKAHFIGRVGVDGLDCGDAMACGDAAGFGHFDFGKVSSRLVFFVAAFTEQNSRTAETLI